MQTHSRADTAFGPNVTADQLINDSSIKQTKGDLTARNAEGDAVHGSGNHENDLGHRGFTDSNDLGRV